MKKLAFLLVCALCSLKCLIANPICDASIWVNEIMFDSEEGWKLELECLNGNWFPYLSITVSSSSGSAESNSLPVWDGYYSNYKLFVLTRDSMKTNLDINPLGDKITVKLKYLNCMEEIDSLEHVLIFGDYKDARINAPSDGQSIGSAANLSDVYSFAKTNEPTMGTENDVSKMYGTLTGKIYDKNNQLVMSNDSMTFFYSSIYYYGPENPPLIIYRNVPIENGTYSIKALANRLTRNYVYISNQKIKISPFQFDIEPDAIMEQDIYLLEDYVDIDEVTIIDNSPIRIYPNPLSGGQELRYEVGAPVKSLDCRMEIISMDGRVTYESKITDNSGSITLPHSLPNGTYLVNFKLNNKTHYATRLIIGK